MWRPASAASGLSAPRTFSAGTRQLSNVNAPQAPWRERMAASVSITVRPGVSRGTSSVATPFSPVLARTTNNAASEAPTTRSLPPLIIDAERGVAIRLVLGEREVIALLREERRQEARALLRRHQAVEQRLRERRRLRQYGGDVRIADGELFGDDAAGEVVGAGAALLLRQRERAQPHLRGLVERLHQQRPRARLQALWFERERLDRVCDEIADRVADLQLLRTQTKVVHMVTPKADKAGYDLTLP